MPERRTLNNAPPHHLAPDDPGIAAPLYVVGSRRTNAQALAALMREQRTVNDPAAVQKQRLLELLQHQKQRGRR